MREKLKNVIKLLPCLLICLTSCNKVDTSSTGFEVSKDEQGSATIKIYKNNSSTATSRFIPPSKVSLKHTYNELSGTLSNNENVCPSTGDVNLLVIPVHLPNSDKYKTDEVKQDIEKIFFSENDSSLGFKSVKEYFYESSYGKLNFNGKVTDWFDATSIVTSDLDITQGTSGTIIQILEKATDWAIQTQGIDINDYDQNKDGAIDGIWLVYDHLDWSTQLQIEYEKDPNYDQSQLNSAFWNFTGWDYLTTSTPNSTPTTSGFSWASFDMMYTSYCDRNENDTPILDDLSSIKLDSHTFIHETGHLLGLDDYYSSSDSYYHPAGKATMMDQNICDLDSYSKMLLGWVTPYVCYGTSEIVIPKATSSDHAVIVIPSNYQEVSQLVENANKNNKLEEFTYEFNPFSEYLMIDVYTPDGLNSQDTYGPYVYDRETGATKTGVRIYHIDSRIFKCSVINYDGGQLLSYDEDNYEWDGDQLESNEAILMPILNNKTESSNFQLPSSFDYFDQIRLLQSSQINTFDKNEYFSDNDLFNEESKPFSIETYGYQFFNGNYSFNNGNDLPFLISVETLKELEI